MAIDYYDVYAKTAESMRRSRDIIAKETAAVQKQANAAVAAVTPESQKMLRESLSRYESGVAQMLDGVDAMIDFCDKVIEVMQEYDVPAGGYGYQYQLPDGTIIVV